MRYLRLDSVGGASGDMLFGALWTLCERCGIDPSEVEERLKRLIPEPFYFHRTEKSSHGVSGTMWTIEIPEHDHVHSGHDHAHSEHDHAHSGHDHAHSGHDHAHRSFGDIQALIENSDLPEGVKRRSLTAFSLLAEAEGRVHGVPAQTVHFHEVGATDSILDTVGACYALELLDVAGVSLSPIPIGGGTVTCAHGVYPVPAPAVVEILRLNRFPVAWEGELCEMLTPTAASLLATWEQADIPVGAQLRTTVYALGHREMVSRPNLLRASLYETTEVSATGKASFLTESLIQFETNLDDMTGEQLAAAMAAIFASGALDVWFTAVTMKKNRPGVLLGALCLPELRDTVRDALFRHTSTFGVRETTVLRHSLARRWETVETIYGTVRVKIGLLGDEPIRVAPEFEDCRAIADSAGISVAAVMEQALFAWRKQG